MRLMLAAFGRVLIDLYLLEPEEQPAADDEAPPEAESLAAVVELFAADPPFGFRPGPWPWPLDWE